MFELTEHSWVLKVKYAGKSRIGSFADHLEMEKDIMEKLLEWSNRLKKEGYKYGIYGIRCSVVKGEYVGEKEPFVAICEAKTYGDIDWLNYVEKPPSIEVSSIVAQFNVNEEELKSTKELLEAIKR